MLIDADYKREGDHEFLTTQNNVVREPNRTIELQSQKSDVMTVINDEYSNIGETNLNFVGRPPLIPDLQKYNTLQHEDKNALKNDEPICRICLCEDEPDNPIISACKCIGSVKYIHV